MNSWMRVDNLYLVKNPTVCYRDSEEGKHKCDDKMLQEFNKIKLRGFREKIDKKLVRSIIGKKRTLGWGILEWSDALIDELHKPIRKKFKKSICDCRFGRYAIFH